MKNLILVAFSLLFIVSCNKEEESLDSLVDQAPDLEVTGNSGGSNKVTICHLQGNGNYAPLEVNVNSVPGHLNHGDYLPDADGDGYTAIGACTGSADDCDDTDAAINPGQMEVPYNGIDDDCDPTTLDDDLDQDGFVLAEDCNDEDPNINPDAPELCSGGVDEDCDNLVDCDDPDCDDSPDCENCDMTGLRTVTVNGATLYVHPENSQQGVGVRWGFTGLDIQGVTNTSDQGALNDFNGATNTTAIYTESQNEPFSFIPFAAKICEELEAYGCDDWYLPSIGELKAMSDQLGSDGTLPQALYWSSSEEDANNAHLFFVLPVWPGGGYVATQSKSAGSAYKCRCVRKD